jgi:hypothetical protein
VERIIRTVPAYSMLEPYEISLREFLAEWLPRRERDDTLVGVNWSGSRALGYDLAPSRLAELLGGSGWARRQARPRPMGSGDSRTSTASTTSWVHALIEHPGGWDRMNPHFWQISAIANSP